MEEVSYMVCMRVDELDDPVEGSTTTACVDCGTDIWISAESRTLMAREHAMPLCSRCAERIAREEGAELGASIGDMSAGQMEEVVESLRKTAIEKGHPEWLKVLDHEDMDLFESMKIMAQMAGEKMRDPGDDWGSMAVMQDDHGVTYPPIPLSEMMKAGVPKEAIARQLIPAMIQAAGAVRIVMGLSTWTLAGEKGEVKHLDGPISEHPDRKEAVCLIDITADGVQAMSMAEIIRDGVSKPTLGEWHDSETPTKSDGLFVDAIVPTLQFVRTLRG